MPDARCRLGLALALSLLLALAPRTGRAQASAEPAVAAEDLFQRARALLAEDRAAEACPLLLESYRLDGGGGTLQNLALCYEKIGKWASAAARYQELRSISQAAAPPRADRVTFADGRLAEVGPKVTRLVVDVPPERATAATVEIDGIVYKRASWATGIPLDPGSHAVVARAGGGAEERTTVVIPTTGGEQRLALTFAGAASPDPADTGATPERAPPARAEASDGRRLGYAVGGAGLAVLAGGLVFGALAIAKNDEGSRLCRADGGSGAPPSDFAADGTCIRERGAWRRANEAKDDAETFANVANVLVPVGVLAAAAGAYLVLRAPRAGAKASLRLAPTLGGASLGGTF